MKTETINKIINFLRDKTLRSDQEMVNNLIEELSTIKTTAGIDLIASERIRQIEKEGWTAEHDDQHMDDELALAAACYAIPELEREYIDTEHGGEIPNYWPWEEKWWKPEYAPELEKKSTIEGRIRELTKAGALIAAAIDQLQRVQQPEEVEKNK